MKQYLSLVKFSHTIFAMPFAILGLIFGFILENINFNWKILFLVIACMVFARNIAMAFNRLIDSDIDKKNIRTLNREIPSGKVSKNGAIIFILLNIIFFILCTYFINLICFKLSIVAIIVIMVYSITKRYTFFCHLFLGVSLALAPIGAFLSVTGYFTFYIIILGLSVLFWVSGFDIIYSLQDYEFDKKNNLFSIPVWLGLKNAKKFSAILHILSSISILYLGYLIDGKYFYYLGCILFMFFLYRQHKLVNVNQLNKIEASFFTNNGIASVLFTFFLIVDMLFFKS